MNNTAKMPIYRQIEEQLIERIVSGVYPLNSCLPSERDIQQELGVTRKTVRRALELLEEKGIIAKEGRRLSKIVRRPQAGARNLAFMFAGMMNSMYDVYHQFFQEIKSLALTHRENFYYIDGTMPVSPEMARIQFDTVFVAGKATDELEKLLSPQTKLISLDDYPVAGADVTVCLDNYEAGVKAAEALLSCECSHPVFLGVEDIYRNNLPNRLRRQGFVEILQERGISPQLLDIAPYPNVEKVIHALRKLTPESDGIFAINDYIGIMATRALSQLGWRVPKDIKLLSIDGQEMGEYTMPPLTTMAQPCREIAETAYKYSLKDKSEIIKGEKIMKSVRMIFRESLPKKNMTLSAEKCIEAIM